LQQKKACKAERLFWIFWSQKQTNVTKCRRNRKCRYRH